MILDYSQLPELTSGWSLVAGVDEVGRGALLGPVVAAAAMIPLPLVPQLNELGVKDSKKLSSKRRTQLAQQIQSMATDWQIGLATAEEIDEINILQASLLAMQRAVIKLKPTPELCLVDGKFAIPDLATPQINLVKGDEKSLVIAAASILAKVWRDQLIIKLAQTYPDYDLAANKGYGTKRHRIALQKYGLCAEHRRSFRPCQVKHCSSD